jgi:hypothetical protein
MPELPCDEMLNAPEGLLMLEFAFKFIIPLRSMFPLTANLFNVPTLVKLLSVIDVPSFVAVKTVAPLML